MIEARDVTVLASGNTLLRQATIAARPGRILVLIGPNGAGKSTLLRVLSGELAPTRGEALLDGRRLDTYPSAELARRRAVVPQASMLAFPFTVLEVAMLGATVPGFAASTTAATEAALEALEAVGLSTLADRLYVHLSGGERQRVHIARALCQLSQPTHRAGESRCLLLDEPTSNLDLAHQSLVLDAVRRQAERGCAVLAVMHDLNLAAALADDMVLLVRGQVAAAGPAAQVLQDGLLSAAYGCEVFANRTPGRDRPFVLPPAVFLPQRNIGVRPTAAPAPAAVHPPAGLG
jgi:iron complex transport system ATP-binding protein